MCFVRIVGRRVGMLPIISCITSARVGVGVITRECCRRGIEEVEEEEEEELEEELEERGRRERRGGRGDFRLGER